MYFFSLTFVGAINIILLGDFSLENNDFAIDLTKKRAACNRFCRNKFSCIQNDAVADANANVSATSAAV